MARVVKEHYPHQMRVIDFPQIDALAGAGSRPLMAFDKRSWLDQLAMIATTRCTPDGVTARFGFANSGQSLAAAVLANQWLTDAIDISDGGGADMADDTMIDSEANDAIFDMDGQTAASPHEFEKGDRLFVTFSAATTGMVNLQITARVREFAQ